MDFPKEKNGDLPVTTSYYSAAAKLPLLLENLPIASRNGPQTATLEMVENPTTKLSQFKVQERAYEDGSSEVNKKWTSREPEVNFADNSGRSNPHAALGRVIDFMDPDTRSQAILKYHQGTVNRPTGRLVRLVKKSEQVPTKCLLFDNMVITDR